mmetsp:Transcript_3870/g.9049  ORF Transcript_3870/g.9049 Transcript_3870/m.9049 type:complete len:226 (-) Transcript_3870:343-1020(-)
MCYSLFVKKELGDLFDLLLSLGDQIQSSFVGLIDDAPGLLVHRLGGGIGVGLITGPGVGILGEGELTDLVVHAIFLNSGVYDVGYLLEIVARAGGYSAKEDLFSRTAGERHADSVHDLSLSPEEDFLREILRIAEGAAASRYYCHLEERVGVLQEPTSDGVAGLMVGNDAAFIVRHNLAALQSTNDSIGGLLEVFDGDRIRLAPCGDDGGLVANVGNVSTGKAGR